LFFTQFFVYFFVNGVAGVTEDSTSIIIFIYHVPMFLPLILIIFFHDFSLFSFVSYIVIAFVYIPAVLGCIFIDYDQWPLTLVTCFLAVPINIWTLFECLAFNDPTLYGHKHKESKNFMMLALSLFTAPIVFPIAIGIGIVALVKRDMKIAKSQIG
jgi:hypothetical protein